MQLQGPGLWIMSIYTVEQHQCAWLSHVKRKEPRFISIPFEEGLLASLKKKSIPLIVFKITCSFQAVVCGGQLCPDEMSDPTLANCCPHCLPLSPCALWSCWWILPTPAWICRLPTGDPLASLWDWKCCWADAHSNSVYQSEIIHIFPSS